MVVCFVDAAFKTATSSITNPTILDAGYIHDSPKTDLHLTCRDFLTSDVNMAFAEVTGEKVNRRAGYGLEIPCVYCLYGPKAYVDRIKEITGRSIMCFGLIGVSLSEPHVHLSYCCAKSSLYNYIYIYILLYIRAFRPSGVLFGPAKGPFKRSMRKRRPGQ